jgi:hypothetical protein
MNRFSWHWIRGLLRRLRARKPSPPTIGIGVVDGTGYHAGGQLCAALVGSGLPASTVDAFGLATVTRCLVLLLPAKPAKVSAATQDLLSVLSALSGDPRARGQAARHVVIVWHVTEQARRSMVAPVLPADRPGSCPRWNAAGLLLGSSWSREIGWHGGDQGAAVHCLSGWVGQLMQARGHDDLGPVTVAELYRYISAFDSGFLNVVMAQVGEPTADGVRYRWIGWESVVAAVRTRYDPWQGGPP